MNKWVICGTRNTYTYIEKGRDILNAGGSAIDAVEEVIKLVELNPNDWSVGFNGFPNLLGKIELDASIMVGSTRKAGAVAGISNYVHAISIARKVMELTPHVLLVGDGAELFAHSIGFKKVDGPSDGSLIQYYNNIMEGKDLLDGLEVPQEIKDLAWRYDRNLKDRLSTFDYKGWYNELSKEYHGTVNVIAMDKTGEICSGVSTSGLALKFPGRAGDSPIIGAGNYCDSRFGAATIVGNGELAIRLGTAKETVNNLSNGDVDDAVNQSIKEVLELKERGIIQVLAMDQEGNVSACSNQSLHYILSSSENPDIERIDTLLLKEL